MNPRCWSRAIWRLPILLCLCHLGRQAPAAVSADLQREAARIQSQVDFVFYLPSHLPQDADPSQPVVVRENGAGPGYVPNQVYLRLGERLAMWQMPSLPMFAEQRAEVLEGPGGQYYWRISTPATKYVTLVWDMEGTRLGLTGSYHTNELMKVASSMHPAAPSVSPRPRYALAPGGIGVTLSPASGSLMVMEVTPGLAAERAGVRPGAEVMSVRGKRVRGMRMEDVSGLIRGAVGTDVKVGFRQPSGRLLEAVMRREPVPTVVSVRKPLEDAVRAVPFRAVMPRYLPKGAEIAKVQVTTITPDSRGVGPRLDIEYEVRRRLDIEHQVRPRGVMWLSQSRAGAGAPQDVQVERLAAGRYVMRKSVGDADITLHTLWLPLAEATRVFRSIG